MTRRFLALGALLSLSCGTSSVDVTGTVAYREGIAFPAGARIHVLLQDVTTLNAAAATVAEQTVVADSGQTTVEFALACDRGEIVSDHGYAVRVEVEVDGELRFLSTAEYSVITHGRPARADIVVDSVWRPRVAPPPELTVPGATTIVGTFAYMADAGLFSFCDTDARFPVKQQGDNAALERAYGGVPHEPGAPVVVTIYGRLEPSLPMEGKMPQDHVIVDRFLQIWPDETCAKVGVETSLSNTYWKLVELDGRAVAPHGDQREVHMLLHGDARVTGFAGCNQFTGGYRRAGPNLHFDRVAATLMACPYSDEERAFLQALERATSYQVLGESLDLRGESGSIARFRAVYLR